MTTASVKRLMNDVKEFYSMVPAPSGIYIVCSEDDISLVHALIIGPEGTPYEKGFFYFVLKYPDDYPNRPPNVQFMTTNSKTVRFNPNLYKCGKVCLSILNTWKGDPWSPSLTIFTTLISIQSLMNAEPYHNEPGFEKTSLRVRDNAVVDYNDVITHETLRVAVIEMLQENSLDARNMPAELKTVMISHFKQNYQFYEKVIQSKQDYDGKPMKDPFNSHRSPSFLYKNILTKFNKLKEKYLPEGGRCLATSNLKNYDERVKKWLSKCSFPSTCSTFIDVSIDVNVESDNEDENFLLYEPEDSDTEESEGECDKKPADTEQMQCESQNV